MVDYEVELEKLCTMKLFGMPSQGLDDDDAIIVVVAAAADVKIFTIAILKALLLHHCFSFCFRRGQLGNPLVSKSTKNIQNVLIISTGPWPLLLLPLSRFSSPSKASVASLSFSFLIRFGQQDHQLVSI